MKMTQRVLPPASGLSPSINISGRVYACALGASIDVPDADASIMVANGWTAAANQGGAGSTAQRPAAPGRGAEFHDTTLGKNIHFDGLRWRDPTSGAAV